MLSPSATEKAFESDVAGVRARRDLVIVSGEEAATYLQGQLSQDIVKLDVDQSAWSLLLDPQGRVDAWLRVTRTGDQEFWLDTDLGYGQAALDRLTRFKLRTRAEFSLVVAHVFSIRGPNTPSLEQIRSLLDTDNAVVVGFDWPGIDGVDVISVDPIVHTFGADEGAPEALEALRIQLGVPRMGAEFGEKTIPAETGVVDRSADFAKGCYVGQELVARVDSRGNNTPRRVLPVMIDGPAPEVGVEVLVDGEPVGVITSSAATTGGAVALASIKRGVESPAAGTVQVDGVTHPARVGEATWR